MADIKKPCSTEYTAFHHSGVRKLSRIKWIVIHDTESTTAKSTAMYFATPASKGSAHLVIDDNYCYRTLLDRYIPWAAPGANTNGFHIELVGKAKWLREVWLEHEDMLHRAAYKAAIRCIEHEIPVRWVGPLGLRAGRKGFTTHADCSKAFGGDHTDPGTGFPKDKFLPLVTRYIGEIIGA